MLMATVDSAFHAEVRDAVEGVVARATATDDENAGVGDAQRADFLVHERGRTAVDGLVFQTLNHVRKGGVMRRRSTRRCSRSA